MPIRLRSALWMIVMAGGSACALGACGKGPDLTTGPDLQVYDVASPQNQSCFGCAYVSGVAIGTSAMFFSIVDNNQGGLAPSLASVDFTSRSVTPSAWPAGGAQSVGMANAGFDIASSGDGHLFWTLDPAQAVPIDGGPGPSSQYEVAVFTSSEQAFLTSGPASGASIPPLAVASGTNASPFPMGIVADTDAVYVATGQQGTSGGAGPQSNISVTPDVGNFPGGNSSSGMRATGMVARIDRATSSVLTLQGFTFAPGYAFHILAQNKSSLFWPDYGANDGAVGILQVSKASFGAALPTPFVAIAPAPGQPSLTLVGIAANDDVVAWSASQAPGTTAAEPGCQIWVRTAAGTTTKLYDSFTNGAAPTISCYGLAVDDAYAYVAVVSQVSSQNGSGPNGGSGQVLVGKGVARVPLAGGTLQVASLQSNRWYGPRRVLVDGTYVYAIDPSFVARFPKRAFSN